VEDFKFPYVRRISSSAFPEVFNELNSKVFGLMMNWLLKILFPTGGELIIGLPRMYLRQKTK